MSDWTETCQMCGQPIDDGAPASQYVPWPEHADRRICVANIRADERATTYARKLDRAEIIRADERERLWAEIQPLIVVVAQNGSAKAMLPYWQVRKVLTGKEQWDD